MSPKKTTATLTLYFIRAREGGFVAVDAEGRRLAHIRGSNPSMLAARRIASEATRAHVTLVGAILTAWECGPYEGTSITADEHDATLERLQAAELEPDLEHRSAA